MADPKDKQTEAAPNAAEGAAQNAAAEPQKTPAKKAPAKKAPAKKAPAKKAAPEAKDAEQAEQTETEKTDAVAEEKGAKKAPAKKAPGKKAPGKKAPSRAKKAPARETAAEPTFVRATAKYVRSAPRKARLVVDHIRGESVEDARVFLQFTARHVGRDVAKVLESAVANAEHNHELDADDLHVVKAYVDEGPTLKRWRPRAKGRATQILKRTSHITVVVSDVPAKELKKHGKVAA
jgi:ribosomal protein L22